MPTDIDPADAWHLLHLEDSAIDHALVRRELAKSGRAIHIDRVETLADFDAALDGARFDAILADYRLAGFTALDAWQRMHATGSTVPFILLSGAIGEAAAVAAIQTGISDYLSKDDLGRLYHVIDRAIELHQTRIAKELADRELAQSRERLAGFAEHLQHIIEQERAAIAREIHDDIGGALAAIRFDLFWLQRHCPAADAQEHIGTATEMLQQAIEASQRIMRNLRPAILDQGLSAAITWLADSFSRRTGIDTHVAIPHEPEGLPKEVLLVAYRTAQEALTNIAKHAQCSRVQIELSDSGGMLTLEVRDDGIGLTPQDREKQRSFGLRGMVERAKTVEGWVDISSQPGVGTSITLSIPLSASLS
ncbi:ATP-binding protein [Candidatus Symbiobacter mobilis]|nr:ATP-binding protein [Candidatus Symbiobacter mobilis]